MVFLETFNTSYYQFDLRADEFVRNLPNLVVDLWKSLSVNWSRRWNRRKDAGRKRPRNGGNSVWKIIAANEHSQYIPGQQTRHASRGWRYKPAVWPLLERLDDYRKWEKRTNDEIRTLMDDIRWMLDNPPVVPRVHECGDCLCHLDAYRAMWEAEHQELKAICA